AARAPVIDAATPRAAAGNGATPKAAHTKNKKDREAYNGCCPCGHRDSLVCLCVYFDETMRGASSAVGAMVTGRGCFPVRERGHRWLPESRPAVPSSGPHMCTARQRHCLSLRRHRESVRRVAVLMSTTPDEPESRPCKAEPLSIRSLSCGLSWAILRLAD